MRRKGFTLSELIISLAVIGIASALMMPAITKLLPDNNKARVINAHARLSIAVAELLGDDSIYWCPELTAEDILAGVRDVSGLACTGQPHNPLYVSNDFQGQDKFKNLLISKLNLQQVQGQNDTWSDVHGIFWRFVRNANANPNSTTYTITIDLNGAAAPNAVYGVNEKKPDRFIFGVNNAGVITPSDALSQVYLRTAFKTTLDKNATRQEADRNLRRNMQLQNPVGGGVVLPDQPINPGDLRPMQP